jgi:hypothetical protein
MGLNADLNYSLAEAPPTWAYDTVTRTTDSRGARFERRTAERALRSKARRAARRARTTSDSLTARGFSTTDAEASR